MADEGFLSRWSRRKQEVREGRAPGQEEAPVAPSPQPSPASGRGSEAAGEEGATPPEPTPPPPTLDDVKALTFESDFKRFVARDVDPDVKKAAMKKLFADPRFNVMDGLDVYIDDYSKPDPLPDGWLEKMNQVRHLGIFRDDPPPEAAKSAGEAPTPPAPAVEGEPRRLDAATAAPRDPLPASQGDKDPTSRS